MIKFGDTRPIFANARALRRAAEDLLHMLGRDESPAVAPTQAAAEREPAALKPPEIATFTATFTAVPKSELTVTDVARRLGKSRSWVYERMDAGDLPYSQVSARRRVVRAQDLEAFLISRRG